MHRLRCLVVTAALALVGVVVTGPAAAAKGGNNDTAKTCQHGGWQALGPVGGGTFANQGDCVNDGAKGLGGTPGLNGQTACGQITGSTFTGASAEALWVCSYPESEDSPKTSRSLLAACLHDILIVFHDAGELQVSSTNGDLVINTCTVH